VLRNFGFNARSGNVRSEGRLSTLINRHLRLVAYAAAIGITFSFLGELKTVVKFRSDSLAWPRRRAGVTHNVFAPRFFRSEVSGMEDRAPDVSSSVSQQSISRSATGGKHLEGRGAWVLTAYGISGLALFAILAYFFSDFIAH
jgi:hypothetical protein